MRENLVGYRFGDWIVMPGERPPPYVLCQCTCGTVREVQRDSLKRGTSTSCGCRVKAKGIKHGACIGGLTPEYRAWSNMLSRCRNPNHHAYANYGGRGISVCKRWLDFTNFRADMGPRPPGRSLERRKNGRGYSKANCYWATRAEQESNKRTTRMLTAFGETKTMASWERDPRCEVPASTLRWRIRAGMKLRTALKRR